MDEDVPISGELTKNWSIPINPKLEKHIIDNNIKPADVRLFVKNFRQGHGGMPRIRSSDWRKLRDLLINNPAMQLVGNINSGKTHLVKMLIENDKDRIYVVLDSHNEFDLPEINQLTTKLDESCKLSLPKEPIGAVAMFEMYKDLIRREKFPAHYVLVVEEALRYEHKGLQVVLAECRKFIKPLAIMQKKLYDFCPAVQVIPYNKFQL